MKPYPIVIKYSDFTVNTRSPRPVALPRLHITKSTLEAAIRNGVSTKSCGPEKLWLQSRTTKVDSTKFYTLSGNIHPDIAETDTSRYHFAPLYEDVFIRWDHKNPELIKESKLELFCRIGDRLTNIWTKTFTWDDCPPKCATRFQGNLTLFDEALDKRLNKGLRSVKLDYDKGRFEQYFPGDCLTAQFSTYQLRLTVTPKSPSVMDAPKAMWMYFDILVHSIDLEWGDVALLPKKRDDIDPVYKEKILGKDATTSNPKVVGFEENLLLDLKNTAKGGHVKPDTGKKHKVILTSNLFTVKKQTDQQNFETGNFTDYSEHQKLWGYGPRIPLIAKVSIKTSDNKGTYKVPEALTGGRILWDWEDDAPTRWKDAVTAGETPNFTQDFLDTAYHIDGVAKPVNSCNSPKSFGGKLFDTDPKAAIFPEQDAKDVFPFEVESCATRKWAAFSYFKPKPVNLTVPENDTAKEERCKTGVIFQPSRMGGDKYKITACFDFTPLLDAETPLDAPAPVKKEAGEFEVFRRVNLKYLTYGNPNLNCNPVACLTRTAQLYQKEANLILEYDSSPMDADFKTAYQNAKKRFLEDKFSYEKVGAYCWSLLFDYFIDDNFAPGAPPLNFKEMDAALTDLENAFKKGKIYEFTNIDNRQPLFKERISSKTKAVGVQLATDVKDKLAIFVKEGGGVFRNNDEVIGEASKVTGKIAIETKPSFWGVTYAPDETSTDNQYNDKIDVTINGTVYPIIYSRQGIKRQVRTDLSPDAKNTLKQALNNCDQSTTPTIKFKSKENPSEDGETRLKEIKEFVKNSVIDRKAWFEKVKGDHSIPDAEPEFKKVGLYDYFPLAFIPMIIAEYIKIKHPKDEGIFLFHIPGRTNLKDLAVAPLNKPFKEPSLIGGNFPEISTRHQGIVYISSLPPGAKVATSPSKNMEAIFSHEIAHALFLPHALKRTGMPAGGEKEKKHVKGGTCLMNYDLDSKRFCGLCQIRLRGWKTEDANYNLGAEKFEYQITVELGNINDLFQDDVNTPKGKQERMQVLGLLNYPLDHPDITACFNYSWRKCEQLFPTLRGAGDSAIRTLFETEIKKMLVGTTGVLPTPGQFARIRVPTFTTMYSLNHLEARIPVADQGKPVAKPYERLMLGANRFETEEYFYTANPALGKIPLLIKVKQRVKGSGMSWATAPEAKHVDVHIALEKPDDFSGAKGPATVNVAGGVSHYNDLAAPPLEAKPKTYITTNFKANDTMPDGANAETRFGGKRGKIVFRQPKDTGFAEITRDTSDDLKVITDNRGEAKIIFDPSRIGGDAYKLCFYVGRPTQEKDIKNAGDDIVKTGTMVRWRTIRISNYYRVNNSTSVANLPAYLKPHGKVTSNAHDKHFGTIPLLDLRGHITKEFAKSYCEIILEAAAMNPLPLANEEGNIRLTLNQLLTTYPKYNNYSSVKFEAGGQNYPLNVIYDKLTEDRTDTTRRTFIGKTRAFPIELGSVSIRPWFSKVDPSTLKETEERLSDISHAVLTDEGCVAGDNGRATGKQAIVSKSINYATGDIRIVFKEQQQRNYQVYYKPVSLIHPPSLLQIPFPTQTPYLINLRLPDDYNLALGAGFTPMEKDAQGNLPKGNIYFQALDSATLGLVKGLFLDSVARGINQNNGFNPGLILVQAQWLDNVTAVGDPGASQEGKAVGQTVFLFTGASTTALSKDEADRYKSLTIHEMSHALYLQHAPSETAASGAKPAEHDVYPGETCVMSYGKNDADHCGKCVAALRGINIRNI